MSFSVSEVTEDPPPFQTIYVLRHGDRADFALGADKWKEIAQRVNDPPLSADVGAAQAVDLHAHFRALLQMGAGGKGNHETEKEEKEEETVKITKIVTSPFLRCIQTANPIAQALDLPLCVENSLWEVVFTAETMPSLHERACYYPRIDLQHESCFQPEPHEPFPEAALERYGRAAFCLEERYGCLVCIYLRVCVCACVCLSLSPRMTLTNSHIYPHSNHYSRHSPSLSTTLQVYEPRAVQRAGPCRMYARSGSGERSVRLAAAARARGQCGHAVWFVPPATPGPGGHHEALADAQRMWAVQEQE